MEAKSLRIGNIIKSEANLRQEMIVLQLFGDSLQADFGNGTRGGIMYENCNGIPLTEEWLIKFGFYKNEYSVNGVQYSEPFWHPALESKGWFVRWTDKWVIHQKVSDYNQTPVRYVHQLQNLFFALTGEELEIKKVN